MNQKRNSKTLNWFAGTRAFRATRLHSTQSFPQANQQANTQASPQSKDTQTQLEGSQNTDPSDTDRAAKSQSDTDPDKFRRPRNQTCSKAEFLDSDFELSGGNHRLSNATQQNENAKNVNSLIGQQIKVGKANRIPKVATFTGSEHAAPTYSIDRFLAAGGMGTVFLATRAERFSAIDADRDSELYPSNNQEPLQSSAIAIKVPHTREFNRLAIERLISEATILQKLDHPNIVRFAGNGTTQNGTPMLAMEWIDGPSLTEYCQQHSLNIAQRIDLFRKVCEGVRYCHSNGVFHHDIKPDNLLVANLEGEAQPKLIDFGIAKTVTDEGIEFTHDTPVGTLQYMSPEQANPTHRSVDHRSDIFSLGMLLLELVTGRSSRSLADFADLSLEQMLSQIAESRLCGPENESDRFNKHTVEIAIERIAIQCTQPSPDDRFQSVEELLSALALLKSDFEDAWMGTDNPVVFKRKTEFKGRQIDQPASMTSRSRRACWSRRDSTRSVYSNPISLALYAGLLLAGIGWLSNNVLEQSSTPSQPHTGFTQAGHPGPKPSLVPESNKLDSICIDPFVPNSTKQNLATVPPGTNAWREPSQTEIQPIQQFKRQNAPVDFSRVRLVESNSTTIRWHDQRSADEQRRKPDEHLKRKIFRNRIFDLNPESTYAYQAVQLISSEDQQHLQAEAIRKFIRLKHQADELIFSTETGWLPASIQPIRRDCPSVNSKDNPSEDY